MEEKILDILINMQKDMSKLKEDVSGLKEDVSMLKEKVNALEENSRIMKNNIAKILEQQIKMNENFEEHKKLNNLKHKEFDYRLTALEI